MSTSTSIPTSTPVSAAAVSALNPKDDIGKFLAWFRGGTMDLQDFANYLPFTALDLKQHKVSSVQVAKETMALLKANNFQFERQDALMGQVLFDVDNESTIECVCLMIPRHWCRCQDDDKLVREFANSWFALFWHNMTAEREFRVTGVADVDGAIICRAMYQAAQYVCRKWALRLDRHFFQGKKGTFLNRSPLAQASLDEFKSMMDVMMDDRRAPAAQHKEDLLEFHLQVVAHFIAEGHETCWECGTATKLQKCAKCQVALYCCRDCQVQAWKSGHKSKCVDVRTKYEKLEDAFQVVEDAHFKGFIHGVPLDGRVDYNIATRTVFNQSTVPDSALSMKTYYLNLGRVMRKEWWLFSNTDTISVYRDKVKTVHKYLKTIIFEVLCELLCNDFFTYAATKGIHDPAQVTEFFEDQVQKRYKNAVIDAAVLEAIDCPTIAVTTLPPMDVIRDALSNYFSTTHDKVINRYNKNLAIGRLKEQFHK